MSQDGSDRQRDRALVTIKNPKAVDIILDIKKTFRGKFAANAILYYARTPEGTRMQDALRREPEAGRRKKTAGEGEA